MFAETPARDEFSRVLGFFGNGVMQRANGNRIDGDSVGRPFFGQSPGKDENAGIGDLVRSSIGGDPSVRPEFRFGRITRAPRSRKSPGFPSEGMTAPRSSVAGCSTETLGSRRPGIWPIPPFPS